MPESFGLLNLIGLLALGAAWLATVRLVFARRSSQGDDLMQRGMTLAGWVLVHLGMLGLLALFVGPVALALWPVFLMIVSMAVGRYRYNERRSLLWALALAAERGIPLEQAANAFADERYDETGLRAARLAKELERGIPLPDAVRNSGNFLPFDARLACGVGWQAGCLGPALRRVVEFQEETDLYLRRAMEKFLYLAILLVACALAATYLITVVMPGMDAIYAEFDIELPWANRTLFRFADAFVIQRIWVFFLPLYFLIFVAAVALVFYYLGWVTWEPWLVRRLWRRLHTAWILRYLGFLVEQGRPLEQGVRLLSANYPATYIAQRLYAATGSLAAGRPWFDALQSRGLIRAADAQVLHAAQRADNLRWALEELSESNLRRLALRLRTFLNVGFPVLILLLGALIFAFVVTLYLPFPLIIEKLQ